MADTQKYFNPAQVLGMVVDAKDEFIVGSRALGKSEGFDARRSIKNIFSMPRSNGAILSPTYSKLLQNTLPAMAHGWERWGYIRNVHYYIGRKAPRTAGFQTPYIEPFSYEHVIHWFNGSIMHLISFDRAMSTNSMSLDYVIGPEAKFLNFDKIKNEVNPALRGNRQYFKDCHLHGGSFYSTDMPTSKSGMWILDKQNEMDSDLIDLIKLTYLEYISHKDKNTVHHNREAKRLKDELTWLRSKALYYAEFNVFDNLEVLGEEWIAKQKRDLPALIFRTAILNERLKKVPNGFYSSLEENIHFYTPPAAEHIEELNYTRFKSSCIWDTDIHPDLPLRIANDYNAAINSLVCGQKINNEMRTLKSIFVKTPLKLADVVQNFCDYYTLRINRDVIYFFDSTAIFENPVSGKSFSDIVISVLTANNFRVTPVYIGQPISHAMKHEYINLALKGDPSYLHLRFNLHNNEYLKIALEQAGIKIGRNGFEKDKSAEKEPDSPEQPDEVKTHITDAWDTLFIGSQFYDVAVSSAGNAADFIGH